MFEDLGYNIETHGQKSFNGVALLSKLPFDEVSRGLPGDDSDTQARFIEGVFSVTGGAIRVASLYLPNGNPVGTDKYAYKFAWMERLEAYAKARLAAEEMFVLAGDYNVIPEPIDARYPERLGRRTRSSSRRLAPASAASSISGSPAPSAPATPSPATTPSGTIRPAPGSGTTASASTTSCSRRSPPTGSSARRSTSARGAGTSRPTTCR